VLNFLRNLFFGKPRYYFQYHDSTQHSFTTVHGVVIAKRAARFQMRPGHGEPFNREVGFHITAYPSTLSDALRGLQRNNGFLRVDTPLEVNDYITDHIGEFLLTEGSLAIPKIWEREEYRLQALPGDRFRARVFLTPSLTQKANLLCFDEMAMQGEYQHPTPKSDAHASAFLERVKYVDQQRVCLRVASIDVPADPTLPHYVTFTPDGHLKDVIAMAMLRGEYGYLAYRTTHAGRREPVKVHAVDFIVPCPNQIARQ
jgi:hypothetical protein